MSGRSWTTTLPPLDSSSVHLLAGSAATSAGTVNETGGLAGAGGACLAATNARARKGNATKRLIIPSSHLQSPPTIAADSRAPVLFQFRRDIGRYGRRHELVDRAAIAGDFFHQP